jgi:hypothetical protein
LLQGGSNRGSQAAEAESRSTPPAGFRSTTVTQLPLPECLPPAM